MVKNAGGNKSKRIGRKHVVVPDTKGVRYATDQGEEYAVVTKLFGGTCQVICRDGTSRICIIRKKFKGRGKRDSIISPGVWLLVGIRDWEAPSDKKPNKCDLLEVYSQSDKDCLIKTSDVDLSVLKSASNEYIDKNCDIEFTNYASNSEEEAEEDEDKNIPNISAENKSSLLKLNMTNLIVMKYDDEEFNVDDI